FIAQLRGVQIGVEWVAVKLYVARIERQLHPGLGWWEKNWNAEADCHEHIEQEVAVVGGTKVLVSGIVPSNRNPSTLVIYRSGGEKLSSPGRRMVHARGRFIPSHPPIV